MKIYIYKKGKIIAVETKAGRYFLTEKGIVSADADLNFGAGADKVIDIESVVK